MPLGAATGPAAQGLICAEFRETNRTFNNTGGGTDTLWSGTQVGVKKNQVVRNMIWILLFTDVWRWISAVAALTALSWSFTGPWVLRMYLPPDLCVQLAGSLRRSLTEPFSWSWSDPQTVPLVLSSPGAKAGRTQVAFLSSIPFKCNYQGLLQLLAILRFCVLKIEENNWTSQNWKLRVSYISHIQNIELISRYLYSVKYAVLYQLCWLYIHLNQALFSLSPPIGSFSGVYVEKVGDSSGEGPYIGLLGIGDEILQVNGEAVAGLSLDQVTRLMTRESVASLRIMPARRIQRWLGRQTWHGALSGS